MRIDETIARLPADAGRVLLPLAREAIARELGVEWSGTAGAPWLDDPGAAFVTLTTGGELRGCIGSLEARRALGEDVRANAIAAAFRDPRFPPLEPDEFDVVAIEVSVLSPPQPLAFANEDEALAQLVPHADGIIFEYGYHRSTFLPQVWEKIPAPREFLANLKYKAGLPPDFWDATVRLARYSVTKWSEAEAA
jgi:AmmeMemoRadiSam system protein A